MLLSLHIKNFMLIEQLEMELQPGLNVLTGETGAGKSIILGALRVALGGRAAPTEQIRAGAEKMWLQAVFDAGGCEQMPELLESQGVEYPEDHILYLTRETTRAGRNICRVNGQGVPLSFYRMIGGVLVDVHVQHEQHSLLDPAKHLDLLDRFGEKEQMDLRKNVADLSNRWRETRNKLVTITDDEAGRSRQSESLRYAIKEIEQAAPRPGEDDELAAERRILANGEKICRLAADAYELLFEGGRGQAPAMDQLSEARELLRNLTQMDESRLPMYQSLDNSYYQIGEVVGELAGLRDSAEYDPRRLEAVEDRIILLNNLKKKYAPTLAGVLEYLDRAVIDLEELEQGELFTAKLKEELDQIERAYRDAAESLSNCRKKAARRLEEDVSKSLLELEMGKVQCQASFTSLEEISSVGGERVEFMVALNPGEPLKSLAKTASGGELSRIMLALKVLLAEADEVPALIFDEVDAGIGGRALTAVAEKLTALGGYHQILCVTHAPQIASHAKAHYVVSKESDGERTFTRIDLLDHNRRIEELARMLDGKEVTEISRQHAGHMLEKANRDGF